MTEFPAKLIADWDKTKSALVPNAQKMRPNGTMITEADIKQLIKISETLVKSFNKDLKTKMTKLVAAKSPADRKKAAGAVEEASDSYLTLVTKATAATKLSGNGPYVHVEALLKQIRKHAANIQADRVQATVPKEFAVKYEQGMKNAVKDVAKLTIDNDAKKKLVASTEKLISSIDLKLKSKINVLLAATDPAAANKAAAGLVDATEQGRKLAREWLKREGDVAKPIYLAMDFTMTKCATSARMAAAQAG